MNDPMQHQFIAIERDGDLCQICENPKQMHSLEEILGERIEGAMKNSLVQSMKQSLVQPGQEDLVSSQISDLARSQVDITKLQREGHNDFSFQGNNAPAPPRRVSDAIIEEEKEPMNLDNVVDELEEQGALRMCDLCYEEASKFYSLKCKHEFCNLCFEEYLESQINEGKVMNITCMQNGCTEEFSE